MIHERGIGTSPPMGNSDFSFMNHVLCFRNLPFADGTGGTVEVHTYLVDFSSVCLEWYGILFAVYLNECLFRGSIVLELEYIDGICKAYHHIGTSYGTLHFGVHILPHQAEEQVKDSLIMFFRFVFQIVGNGDEE